MTTSDDNNSKPWQGRFSEASDKLVEAFTASIDFDQRLYKHDIQGSIAHATMLGHCNILTKEEVSQIVEGLQQIAKETGGQYFRATTAESLEQIYADIDQLEKTEIEITSIKRYSEEFHHFAFWGLLFLVLEILLRYTVFRTIP